MHRPARIATMKTLLLIRHGHAEDSSPMGDVERELTQEGRLKMRLGAASSVWRRSWMR